MGTKRKDFTQLRLIRTQIACGIGCQDRQAHLNENVGRVAIDEDRWVLSTWIKLLKFNGLSDFRQEISTKMRRQGFA